MHKRSLFVYAKWLAASAGVLAAMLALDADGTVLRGSAAFGDWRKDKPGVRRLLTPQDLPPPYVTPSAANFPKTVETMQLESNREPVSDACAAYRYPSRRPCAFRTLRRT